MDVSYVHTTPVKLNDIAKKHGQIIYVTDDTSPENSGIYVDFLDTITNIVERHRLTTLPSLSLQVDITDGHLKYQYSVT